MNNRRPLREINDSIIAKLSSGWWLYFEILHVKWGG